MLVTVVITIVLTAGLWVGLPGIWAGGRVCERRGPEHLMHYPVGVPWFRGKVNTARWVVRTGRLFAGGALLITACILCLALLPTQARLAPSPCEWLTPVDQLSAVAGEAVVYGSHVASGHRCELEVRTDADQARFLKIEVDAPGVLIGASLESQRRELERRSMKLRPLPGLGSDAVVALRPNQPGEGAVFLFTHEGAAVRVQTARSDPAEMKYLARVFAALRKDDA
jgi:hypothetical protein